MQGFLRRSLLGGLIFGASGCYLFARSQTFYGLNTDGQKVVFVLDVSGSMEGKNEGTLEAQAIGAAARAGGSVLGSALGGGVVGNFVGNQTASETTKLGGAKRELIPAIKGLPESSHLAVITFGEQSKPWMLGMVPATASNKNIATALVSDIEANGGTPAMAALAKAFDYSDATVIFFLSDGHPTDAGAKQILDRVAQLNASRKVTIHVIGLGDDQDETFMTALARQNGGTFVRK